MSPLLPRTVGDAPTPAATVLATVVAAIGSGVPSTVHSLVTRRPPLDTVRAAARLVPGARRRRASPHPVLVDVATGGLAHAAVSALWGAVLGRTLPRGHRALVGAGAGVAIHLVDLGLIARVAPLAEVRALPQLPQLADHVAFGFLFGLTLDRLDEPRTRPRRAAAQAAASSSAAG